MFEIAIADIFLKAFILCGLLYFFAKHEADYDFAKVAMVTAGILLGSFVLQIVLEKHIGIFTIIPVTAFVIWMLMQFCWLSLPKAVLVTVAFTAVTLGVDFARGKLLGGMQEKVEKDGNTTRDLIDKQNEEGMQVIRELNESTARMEGAGAAPSPFEAAAASPTAVATPPAPGDTNVIMRTVVKINYSDEGGYTGAYVTNQVAVPINWKIARSKLNITARMMKNQKMVAVVNGQVVSAGGTVTVEHDDLVYKWKLKSLTKDQADWEPVAVADSYRGGVR